MLIVISSIVEEIKVLLERVKIIPLSSLAKKNIQKALTIVEDIDEDDYPFVAMYFQYKYRIWSRDKELILGLTEKGFGHFFISMDEIKEHLYKKS